MLRERSVNKLTRLRDRLSGIWNLESGWGRLRGFGDFYNCTKIKEIH